MNQAKLLTEGGDWGETHVDVPLLAIPAFDHIAGLSNRHLKLNLRWSTHAPAALPPRKRTGTHYRRLGGTQGRYGRMRKIPPPQPGFDPLTVQPVASRYTDCVIPAL
jgi:hypothetical protein